MQNEQNFTDKFIAFIDVLGFKSLVARAEAGTGIALGELLGLLENFGSPDERTRFGHHGPTICPESQFLRRDLDFRLTQVSDCVVVSTEVSPAGVINLVGYCWGIAMRFLQKGIMLRGYITRGSIYHTEAHLIGTGYQRALENERNVAAFKREADERGTPFIEVDQVVCDYVSGYGNACVQEMFSRCVKGDLNGVALFPFKRLQHSFIIGDAWGHRFDPERERRSNQNVRATIRMMKERVTSFVDHSNPSAVRKADHYIKALDSQLAVCDSTDEFLDQMKRSPA